MRWSPATKGPGTDRLVPGVVVVFEVLSPSSGRIDRIEKLLEYRSVPTILRYVMLEHASAAMTVHARANGEDPWTTTALTGGEVLSMHELAIDVPVAEFYEGTEFAEGVSAGREPAVGLTAAHMPQSNRAGRRPCFTPSA
jgi:Uma2 family endonuclease